MHRRVSFHILSEIWQTWFDIDSIMLGNSIPSSLEALAAPWLSA